MQVAGWLWETGHGRERLVPTGSGEHVPSLVTEYFALAGQNSVWLYIISPKTSGEGVLLSRNANPMKKDLGGFRRGKAGTRVEHMSRKTFAPAIIISTMEARDRLSLNTTRHRHPFASSSASHCGRTPSSTTQSPTPGTDPAIPTRLTTASRRTTAGCTRKHCKPHCVGRCCLPFFGLLRQYKHRPRSCPMTTRVQFATQRWLPTRKPTGKESRLTAPEYAWLWLACLPVGRVS